MNSELSFMKNNIKSDIIKVINNFKHDQFIENETIITRRSILMSIESICEEIRRQIL